MKTYKKIIIKVFDGSGVNLFIWSAFWIIAAFTSVSFYTDPPLSSSGLLDSTDVIMFTAIIVIPIIGYGVPQHWALKWRYE